MGRRVIVAAVVLVMLAAGAAWSEGVVWERVGNGVVRSSDASKAGAPEKKGLSAATIFGIASSGNSVYIAGSGFYRSSDGGKTWEQASGAPNAFFLSLTLTPTGTILAGTDKGSIYRSADKGNHWTQVFKEHSARTVQSILVAPNGSIYAAAENGLYVSEPGGLVWRRIGADVLKDGVYAVAMDSDGRIYAGSSESAVFYSDDKGETWKPAGEEMKKGGKRLFKLVTHPKLGIFAIGESGVYNSTDRAKTWTKYHGDLDYGSWFSLVVDSKGRIFAGGFGGVRCSMDGGKTFIHTMEPLGYPDVMSLWCDNKGYIYAGTSEHGLFRTGSAE